MKDQTELLKIYYDNAFNKKDLKFLGEVAGKLRLLVFQSKTNTPLLLSLMDELKMEMPIKLRESPVEPLPEDPKPGESLTLRQYLELNAYYLKLSSGKSKWISKHALIGWLSQQFGAAHQDWEINEEIYTVIKSEIYIGGLPLIALELKQTAKTILYVCDEFIKKINENNDITEKDSKVLQEQQKVKTGLDPNNGTTIFWMLNQSIFTQEGIVIVYKAKAEDTEFLLKRDESRNLIFQHSNPKFGTRISKLNLDDVEKGEAYFVCLRWSPEKINLDFGAKGKKLTEGIFEKIKKNEN